MKWIGKGKWCQRSCQYIKKKYFISKDEMDRKRKMVPKKLPVYKKKCFISKDEMDRKRKMVPKKLSVYKKEVLHLKR